ncbi:MAG: serine/threonine protein kinase [Deltaproteobacteria bacterium]|nr:serine/threonine protein kinase [Deltaproteobacteria bacterium]
MSERLGAYTLLQTLGQGGMADVYLASTAGIDAHVAVKVLSAQRSLDTESCALFLDEARVVRMLDHKNIASVLDVDVSGGRHYLAMEYIHGADLREVLVTCAQKSSLPSYEFSLSVVAQAAAGLDHAHRRCDADGKPLHLVHRDVSLTNIMVGHDGTVKVVDFGIARSTLSSVHTSPGIVRGKPSYMSPEQCLGDKVGHRTDVFALGIVLYELTTGARCFAGKSDFERMLAVVQGDYIAPSDLIADYPPELEKVVRTALAANPELRYASCAALIEAIERVTIDCGWRADAASVQRTMHELFGDVKAPWISVDDEARTIENMVLPISALPTAKITRPDRFPRGTLADMFDPKHWVADDDDAVTRGRRSMRRSSSPYLAA